VKLSATVTAEFGQADGAQEAALDAGLSLLWRLASERQEPQAVSVLFGAVISVQEPAQAG
jgi:hypothetical protein